MAADLPWRSCPWLLERTNIRAFDPPMWCYELAKMGRTPARRTPTERLQIDTDDFAPLLPPPPGETQLEDDVLLLDSPDDTAVDTIDDETGEEAMTRL